jgi:hypothetical protein
MGGRSSHRLNQEPKGSACVSVILLEFELTKTYHFIQRSKLVAQIGKNLINA